MEFLLTIPLVPARKLHGVLGFTIGSRINAG
jgi:hypothetical protein